MEIQKPIFIIGVPRTGTTLLYNILCLHPDLAWFSSENFPEWASEDQKEQMKKHFLELKKNHEKIPVTEESMFVFGPNWREGIAQTKVHPDLKKITIEGELFWPKQIGNKYIKDISDDKKQEIISGLEKLMKEQKKSRFLSKAPQNTMRLFAIKKIFPDVKFVNVVRDPRSVVNSMLQRHKAEGNWDPGIEILDKKKFDKLKLIERFAWRYREITDEIYKFSTADENNLLTISYEDLISETRKIIIKILKYCELDTPKNIDQMIPKIRTQKDGWKKNLSKKQQRKIFDLTKPSMKKMNYPYKQSLIYWFLGKI